MARQAALDYIKSLAHAELAEFFDEALRHLQEGSLPDGLTVFRLAECFVYAAPGSRP